MKTITNIWGKKVSLYFFCKRYMAEQNIPETEIFAVYKMAAELAKKFDSASVYCLLKKEF